MSDAIIPCKHEIDDLTCTICFPAIVKPALPRRIVTTEEAPRAGRCRACEDTFDKGDEVAIIEDKYHPRRGPVKFRYHLTCAEELTT